MWIRIRAVIIEDEPLAAQYLAALLDDTCQVEVVDTAADSESGLRLCAELRPDVVFLDINLPGRDGVSLATQLAMLPQPPRLVFTTGNAGRATDAFRLNAVDYLLKPLDPEQVSEAVNLFSGRPARILANRLALEVGPISDALPDFPIPIGELAPLRAKAEQQGNSDFTPFWSGQASPLGRELPAEVLTLKLAEEARERFKHLSLG
jgi:DNA-binding LytR/AlgR family response regulator